MKSDFDGFFLKKREDVVVMSKNMLTFAVRLRIRARTRLNVKCEM